MPQVRFAMVALGLCRRLDVLVDMEEVVRIILAFNPSQPLVVVAVGGLDPVLALLHHEVDV